MKYTAGPWVYNPDNYAIESETEYTMPPRPEDDEEGIKVQVITTMAAMGGENSNGDIKLICKAPEMFELLVKLRYELNPALGGIDRRLAKEELQAIENIFTDL